MKEEAIRQSENYKISPTLCPGEPSFSLLSSTQMLPKACFNSHSWLSKVGVTLSEGSGVPDPQPELDILGRIIGLSRKEKAWGGGGDGANAYPNEGVGQSNG